MQSVFLHLLEANQRKDLLDALMANDMKISKQALIDEPNAAFISYAVSAHLKVNQCL